MGGGAGRIPVPPRWISDLWETHRRFSALARDLEPIRAMNAVRLIHLKARARCEPRQTTRLLLPLSSCQRSKACSPYGGAVCRATESVPLPSVRGARPPPQKHSGNGDRSHLRAAGGCRVHARPSRGIRDASAGGLLLRARREGRGAPDADASPRNEVEHGAAAPRLLSSPAHQQPPDNQSKRMVAV